MLRCVMCGDRGRIYDVLVMSVMSVVQVNCIANTCLGYIQAINKTGYTRNTIQTPRDRSMKVRHGPTDGRIYGHTLLNRDATLHLKTEGMEKT